MVMSFKPEWRDNAIECLIGDDIDQIKQGDDYYLDMILRCGFKGYQEYTDDELVQEMNERDLWDNWFKETV
jgi:hypothetical protein